MKATRIIIPCNYVAIKILIDSANSRSRSGSGHKKKYKFTGSTNIQEKYKVTRSTSLLIVLIFKRSENLMNLTNRAVVSRTQFWGVELVIAGFKETIGSGP